MAAVLIQKRNGSFILGGACLAKAVMIGLSIICGQTLKAIRGLQPDALLFGFFGLFTLIGVITGSAHFKEKPE